MAFWKKKNYCKYCGSEKNKDGSCPNEKCIKHNRPDEKKEDNRN